MSLNMFKVYLLSIILVFVAAMGNAACNFKTGEFIDELTDPSNVIEIEIKLAKSAKWAKNFLKIATSSSQNIPPKLKKSFSAKVHVHYSFGSCIYSGKVKQNGDWKDHISFQDGQPIRSLNVTLQSGNVLNSVKFKLLIPETREDLHEVFGVTLLNTLGFITPETFKVPVTVNGTKSDMLFQEDTRKELLERRGRREGPIFEGDESLLWGSGRLLNNDDVALSRLINNNWFAKGGSSKNITLKSYQKLQTAYIVSSNNVKSQGKYLDPNQFLDTFESYGLNFPKYHFVMLALGAGHGLIPHNRKYYFNSFQNAFEPIYYDGNIWPNNRDISEFNSNMLKRSFKDLEVNDYSLFITSKKIKNDTLNEFNRRTNLDLAKSNALFQSYWDRLEKSVEGLKLAIENIENFPEDIIQIEAEHTKYLNRASQNKFIDLLIVDVKTLMGGGYSVDFHNGTNMHLTQDEMSGVISRNILNEQRVTMAKISSRLKDDTILHRSLFGGSLYTSIGLRIQIDVPERRVILIQNRSTDWALVVNASIYDWSIEFQGMNSVSSNQSQRFNVHGLTGCLNFYDSTFFGSEIIVNNVMCEDGINIVNSNGSLNSVYTDVAYSDGMDLDFSNLKFKKVVIKDAGNDCLDVSGGVYVIEDATFISCADKGISVGEASTFQVDKLVIKKSAIGVSSKDSSKAEILDGYFEKTVVCAEAFRKKQEFGGAYLNLNKLDCGGLTKEKYYHLLDIDKNSIISGSH